MLKSGKLYRQKGTDNFYVVDKRYELIPDNHVVILYNICRPYMQSEYYEDEIEDRLEEFQNNLDEESIC